MKKNKLEDQLTLEELEALRLQSEGVFDANDARASFFDLLEKYNTLELEVNEDANTLTLKGLEKQHFDELGLSEEFVAAHKELLEALQLDLAQDNIKSFIKKNKAMTPEDLKKLLNLVTEEKDSDDEEDEDEDDVDEAKKKKAKKESSDDDDDDDDDDDNKKVSESIASRIESMSEADLKKLQNIINNPTEFEVQGTQFSEAGLPDVLSSKAFIKQNDVEYIARKYKDQFDIDAVSQLKARAIEYNKDKDSDIITKINAAIKLLGEEKDIGDIIEGEESLSEEFKDKAKILFEAAVADKVASKTEQLRTEFEEQLRERVEANYSSIAEKVDGFLTSQLEEWFTENSVTVTDKLRTEIAEDFIENMKLVFEKHYVTVPEGKIDLYDEVSSKASKLEEQVEADNIRIEKLTSDLEQLRRDKIIAEASEDLYDSQAEKLKKLAENLEYSDEESFAKKIEVIKENFINDGKIDPAMNESSKKVVTTSTKVEEDDGEIDKIMGSYVEALNRQTK